MLNRHGRYIIRNFRKKYGVQKKKGNRCRYVKSLCQIAFMEARKKKIGIEYSAPISHLLYRIKPEVLWKALEAGRSLRIQLIEKLFCIGIHIKDNYPSKFPIFLYKCIKLGYHEVIIKIFKKYPLLLGLHHYAVWGIKFDKWKLAQYSLESFPLLICFYIVEAMQRKSWVSLCALVKRNKVSEACHDRIRFFYNTGIYCSRMFLWYLQNVKL